MASTIPSVELPNGSKMPLIGLGTYRAKDDEIRAAVQTALENGYRHIDTAALYQNEAAIGDVLQEWLSKGKVTREELFITTKLPQIANRAGDVARHMDKALERLKVSYVDLFLIHNPVGFIGKDDDDVWPVDSEGNSVLDMDTDIESLYKEMEEQVDREKTKAIGLSNFNSKQIERIMKVCRIKPANHQIEIHAYLQQKPIRELCAKLNISVCAYSPIAAPYLWKSPDLPILLEHPTVKSLASRLDKTPAQILLRFLIQQDIPVIPKSSSPKRMIENIQVFDFQLSAADMASLDALDQGEKGRVFGFKDFFIGIERHPEWTFHIPF